MKRVLLTIIVVCFFALGAQKALAQGTFDCKWIVTGQGVPQHCSASNDNCTGDFEPDYTYCSKYTSPPDEAGCDSQKGIACVAKGTGTKKSPPVPVLCNGDKGIDTAIGCIPIEDPNALIGFILRWAIGVGGGIAFLLIIFAGFMMMTASGNPDRLKAGQELLTSAIMGIVLLIFSVFVLELIGVDILKLPGFGG
jgi:hypothetical protein